MKNYLEMLQHILDHGTIKKTRTGIDTLSVLGGHLRFDLEQGFPLVTTKFVSFKNIFYELKWFLSGSDNIQYLNSHNVNIWNEWADESKSIGPMYGSQWTNWGGKNINQIDHALDELRNNPNSRRIIISSWNPEFLPDATIPPHANVSLGKMALAPCHVLIHFIVHNGKLCCCFYQRSSDVFLGLPYNIASYALLTHLVAQQVNLPVGELICYLGDCHLYVNHIEQAKLQLNRNPYKLPTIETINRNQSIYEYEFSDLILLHYIYHERIRAKIAV